MTASLSPHEALVFALEADGEGMDRKAATDLVNLMWDELDEPDRDMLVAGAEILRDETLIAPDRAIRLAERIWQTMLEKAR